MLYLATTITTKIYTLELVKIDGFSISYPLIDPVFNPGKIRGIIPYQPDFRKYDVDSVNPGEIIEDQAANLLGSHNWEKARQVIK